MASLASAERFLAAARAPPGSTRGPQASVGNPYGRVRPLAEPPTLEFWVERVHRRGTESLPPSASFRVDTHRPIGRLAYWGVEFNAWAATIFILDVVVARCCGRRVDAPLAQFGRAAGS